MIFSLKQKMPSKGVSFKKTSIVSALKQEYAIANNSFAL